MQLILTIHFMTRDSEKGGPTSPPRSHHPKYPFTFTPTALWHTAITPLPPSTPQSIPTASQLSSLTNNASILLQNDIHTYQSSSSSSSESTLLAKIIQSGTLSDRLSALTLLVQSSPLHNTKALETLKGMAERGKAKGGREESLKALRCVVDWWVGGGAPARKLKCVSIPELLEQEPHVLSLQIFPGPAPHSSWRDGSASIGMVL